MRGSSWPRTASRKAASASSLAPGERHAGLTVNEYETLLMRHDLSEVLRDPLRFMAEKAGHILGNPRAIPAKTLDYAKYDLVRVFNQLLDAARPARVDGRERAVARDRDAGVALPAHEALGQPARLRPRSAGRGAIVEGTYQSPILVQWHRAQQQARVLDVTLTRFV